MADLSLYLFGEPRLSYREDRITIERRKALALLAYLALAEQPQGRDALCSLLWPNLDQRHTRAALRSTLSSLAVLIPVGWLDKDRDTLTMSHEAIWIDVHNFLSLIARSRAHNHAPTAVCPECEPLLVQAAALYRADFLGSFSLAECAEFEDWQRTQREWLRGELSHLLRRLSTYYADSGNLNAAFLRARQWLALDNLHEPAHRQLMRLYAVAGQRTEAIRQYEQCVELLDSELATIPEDETIQLYKTIQANRTTARAQITPKVESATTGILPPLPSLIVGREGVLQELKQRLGIGEAAELRPLTVIQGWPGVGKSTAVAALAHDQEVAQTFVDGVLWASLGENPSVFAELKAWADALKLGGQDRPQKLEDISAQLIAALRDRRMLLILDDVWQIEHAAPFRAGGKSCAMVVTSRLNNVAQALAPTATDLYRLPILDDNAAFALLGQLSPETVRRYPVEALQLIRDLEGLPLAIQVAGRLLHSEVHLGWDINHLLIELQSGVRLLAARAPSDMVGAGRDTLPTVAVLLQRSTDALDSETHQRFAALGLFAPKPATFDLEAMAAAWNVSDARPTTRILVNRGLLEPVSGGRFQMHALLVIHARSLLEQTRT